MEPAKDALRYRLIGPKVQITKIERGTAGLKMHLAMGQGITMIWDLPFRADVRIGDILTLYTEVLADLEHPAPPPPTTQ